MMKTPKATADISPKDMDYWLRANRPQMTGAFVFSPHVLAHARKAGLDVDKLIEDDIIVQTQMLPTS